MQIFVRQHMFEDRAVLQLRHICRRNSGQQGLVAAEHWQTIQARPNTGGGALL